MKLIDITRPIHPNMAVYPGNPEIVLEQVAQVGSDSSALTKITLGSHTGTHIDAPSHVQAGADGTGSYALEQLIGDAEVIEINFQINSKRVITAQDLPETSEERVLIKTGNSSEDIDVFNPDFAALDESAAEELVKRGVKLVGIDGPSIKKKGVRDKTHEILLDAGVIIIESLWLADVQPGTYELICLPLSVDLDGAPVRAVLRGY